MGQNEAPDLLNPSPRLHAPARIGVGMLGRRGRPRGARPHRGTRPRRAVGTYIAPVEEAQETRYVAVGDADVAYQVLGDGPVDLLYFAGLGSHVDVLWEYGPSTAFLRRLASFSRLILFDRRGAGASDAVPNASISTWEAWADDTAAVLDAAGSSGPGSSPRSTPARRRSSSATMHPERVEQLVLANTSARYLVADDYPIGLHPELVDSIVAGIQQTWGTADAVRVVHPDADPELLNWMVKLLRASATPRSAAAQYHYILTSMDVREVLPLIQIPTLVLHTEAHALVPIEQGRYLAANIDGANLVELAPGETYFSPHGYTRVLDEIAEFLTGQRLEVEIDRILTTVLFTDIVGSTALTTSLGDRQYRLLLDAHDRMVRTSSVASVGGRSTRRETGSWRRSTDRRAPSSAPGDRDGGGEARDRGPRWPPHGRVRDQGRRPDRARGQRGSADRRAGGFG